MEGAPVEVTEEYRTQPATKVFLQIFSDDIRHVEKAVSLLETFVKEAITTKNISDDQLKNANPRQVNYMKQIILILLHISHYSGDGRVA